MDRLTTTIRSDDEAAMISRIDHISLAVRDFEKAAGFFRAVLGAVPCVWSADHDLKYLWHVFALGDLSRLELIAPTGEGGLLDGFLAEREGGVHHITLQTPDIGKTKQVLDENGIPYFGYYEYPGGDWKELFIHPRDAFGLLIQVAEFSPNGLIADGLKLPEGKRFAVAKDSEGVSLTISHPGGGTVRLELGRDEAADLAAMLQAAL